MWNKWKHLFSAQEHDRRLQARLEQLRQRTPVPVFWLFGRTQSGKTSLIKYLTGAEEAEIGEGFRPCTRFSRSYQFPTAEAPLITFLDTRGMDEPGYDPAEDLAQFDPSAHVMIVTVKVLDHAQEKVREHLQTIRRARPSRPVILALTCLHEAYPQQQHPLPYPFADSEQTPAADGDGSPLVRALTEQKESFADLADYVVPIDLTPPSEGFNDPNYGGEHLKQVLHSVLPEAYRQTLLTLDEASRELQDLYARNALPHILGYSSLAAAAGAIPVPWVDLPVLAGIQTRMIYHLARFYGQPLSGQRFLEVAGSVGLGMGAKQVVREMLKFIPYVGSVAGAVVGGASTFALGKAFCYYYSAVHQGHVPKVESLRRYYQEQLALAERAWGLHRKAAPVPETNGTTHLAEPPVPTQEGP